MRLSCLVVGRSLAVSFFGPTMYRRGGNHEKIAQVVKRVCQVANNKYYYVAYVESSEMGLQTMQVATCCSINTGDKGSKSVENEWS